MNKSNKLVDFVEELKKIRSKIKEIKFEDIIFNSENNNVIYNEKFLYNILIDIIFEGNFISFDDKQETKLVKRLEKTGTGLENKVELIEIIKNLQYFDGENKYNLNKDNGENKRKVYEEKLSLAISQIDNILLQNKNRNKKSEENTINNNKIIFGLVGNIYGILEEFYPKEILKLHENKIFNFVKHIHNYTIKNIDDKIINLLKLIGINNSTKNIELLKNIERYKDLKHEILRETKNEIISDEEKVDLDFSFEIKKNKSKISEIKEKTIEINNIIFIFFKIDNSNKPDFVTRYQSI